MIDTHCHLIPGIDDGAADDSMALKMAQVALADGVETIVATPHMRDGDYPNEGPAVLAGIERLCESLRSAGCAMRVVAGGEIHLTTDLIEKIRSGRLLTYGGAGRYILLECPYRTRPMGLDRTVFDLRVEGITPVIAHPERTRFFIEEPERYEELLRLGALGQLTTSSLLGHFGRRIQALSEDWVRRRMVHVLASDAHDPEYRPPLLAEARARWANLVGEESARRATVDIPRAMIEGEPFEADEPLQPETPRGLLRRLFSRD